MNLFEILTANTVTCVHEAVLCLTSDSSVFPDGISEANHDEYYLYLQASDLFQLAARYLVQAVEYARSLGSIPAGETSLDLPDGMLTIDTFGNILFLGQYGTETVSIRKEITGFLKITWKTDTRDIFIILESRGRMYLETSGKKRMYYPDAAIFVEDTFGNMYRREVR